MRKRDYGPMLSFWIEHSAYGNWQWNRKPLIMNQKMDTKRYWSSYLGKAD